MKRKETGLKRNSQKEYKNVRGQERKTKKEINDLTRD